MEAHDIDPALTFIVLFNPLVVGVLIVTALVILRELVPFIVTTLVALPVFIVSERQTAATSTVTVIPLFMTTVCPAVGTAAPPQVTVLLHGPETEATR